MLPTRNRADDAGVAEKLLPTGARGMKAVATEPVDKTTAAVKARDLLLICIF